MLVITSRRCGSLSRRGLYLVVVAVTRGCGCLSWLWLYVVVVIVSRDCGYPLWLWMSLVAVVVSRGCGSLVVVAGLSRLSLEIASCNSLVKFVRGFSATLDPKPDSKPHRKFNERHHNQSISGLVAEYIVAIDVTRVRFPADAFYLWHPCS